MLSVEEALAIVLAEAETRSPIIASLDEALGLVLAEDIQSDIDSPPHDKSQVDGYAVIAKDLAAGTAEFDVLEEVTAGAVPSRTVTSGTSTRIMTGAPLPEGANAVVMMEYSEPVSNGADTERVRLLVPRLAPGQNVMRRASSMARGDLVLTSGCRLGPIEIGVLAEVGRTQLRVIPRPSLAVLSTGNELVQAEQSPGAGQIRNSNAPMLVAAARRSGADATDLGIARDEPRALQERISRGLDSNILVISGGVSAGVLDLVPSVLAELGVEERFHKVKIKPGKPLWFGVFPWPAGKTLVFGLPGNPVSSLVCFELFVRVALGKLSGRENALPGLTATLASDYTHRGQRPTYHPARLRPGDGGSIVTPLPWKGSGDLRTLVDANALACFEGGERTYRIGDVLRVLRLEL